MEQTELLSLLNNLISQWENEVVEFKQADKNFKLSEIGQYFSALSNEANLRNSEKAWLVFGVNNKTRKIVGTDYRQKKEPREHLKYEISQGLEPSLTFRNIHEIMTSEGRVLLFEIPVAPQGMPVSYNGHFYCRAGESLLALSLDKLDEIRRQTINSDWTAVTVSDATVEDLDTVAVAKARDGFILKHSSSISEEEIKAWSPEVFLEKVGLIRKGQITRACLFLLGKPESNFLVSPHMAQITWKLETEERAYEHYGFPFILNATEVYNHIRNYQMKMMPDASLVAISVPKYDKRVFMEALHNCIAHQDYSKNSRIIVTEFKDRITFENAGSFFYGKPQEYILGTKTPSDYRNPCLARAMSELGMIDTMGYGIYQMNKKLAETYHHLPAYDLSDSSKTVMTLYAFDPSFEYTKKIVNNKNLSFEEIVKLDAEQKAKLPALSVGDAVAGVWKDVLQDDKNVPQNVPQGDKNVLQDVPQDDKNVPQDVLQDDKNVPQGSESIVADITDLILNLIKMDNKISRKEMGLKLNVSEKTIGRYLKEMSDKVVFRGRGYSGHWEIIEE